MKAKGYSLPKYVNWQKRIIGHLCRCLKAEGSICWQVGNFVENGEIIPLDMVLYPIFKSLGMKLRNRIVWRFGHGLHTRRRFSGRYEVILWYTKGSNYKFNLDDVRIPSKYPGKRFYKGPNKGKLSGNPLGKNPEDVWEFQDVWDIPNVKANHVEKTVHPCQFPVGLVERLVLALSDPGDLVFDPFAGVGSTGVAALIHNRYFWGCERNHEYCEIAASRLRASLDGSIRYRSHHLSIYDHTKSSLSRLSTHERGSHALGSSISREDGGARATAKNKRRGAV